MSNTFLLGSLLLWVGFDTMVLATCLWANVQSWKIGLVVGLSLALQGIIALAIGILHEVDR
jgi:hypothetical protein